MDSREDNIYKGAQPYSQQVNGNSRNQHGDDAFRRKGDFYENNGIANADQMNEDDEFFDDVKHAKPFKQEVFQFENTKEYKRKEDVPVKGIQLIAFDSSSEKFFVNQEALSIIKLYTEPISFVAVAGKYRTGKSFLLNKLLNIKGTGVIIQSLVVFRRRVDASTKSCTQGIWMWTAPVGVNGKQVFFIDTEGSTSIEGNKKNDAKIFSLALLIASVFIFNSVGAIDDRSIQELQLTTQISRNILVSSNVHDNDKAIADYTPKFIWLLRDFILDIVNPRGQKVSPNEYLNNCLVDQSQGSSMSSPLSRKIRASLLQYFRHRECFTMVRPATSEEDLKNLDNLPVDQLRQQFIVELDALRRKVLAMAEPKQMYGQNLRSSTFAQLIRKYVDQINEDHGVPDIKSAWENILEGEAQMSYEIAIRAYKENYARQFAGSKSLTSAQLAEKLRQLRETVMKQFDEGNSVKENNTYYSEFRKRVIGFIESEENLRSNENDKFSNTKNQEILIEMQDELNRDNYSLDDMPEFVEKLREWINRYNNEGKGSNKAEVLAQYLPDILQDQLLRMINDSDSRKLLKEQDSEILALKQQLSDAKKNAELSKNAAIADQKKQMDTLKSRVSELEASNKTQSTQLEKLKHIVEEKKDIQKQLDGKDADLLEHKRLMKEAELKRQKKSKCGCF